MYSYRCFDVFGVSIKIGAICKACAVHICRSAANRSGQPSPDTRSNCLAGSIAQFSGTLFLLYFPT
ncbi:hypothetical protein EV681_1013 [Advenella incenata]|uniref:Uncharacterized protein n=1 Tax=Advenella incenata TaxID=267800 RepID=A0A4Q7VRT2_9BURK|nr:hypothetical protein EV681_1013 [Advenella incenata]